jgi:hypothetical protein
VVVGVVLMFLPLYNSVVVQDDDSTFTSSYGSVFSMANSGGGGAAILGILLLLLLAAMLVTSTFHGTSAAAPGWAAALAALIALPVLTKPGTGNPAPTLTDSGVAAVALLICTAVLTFAHAMQIHSLRRRRV